MYAEFCAAGIGQIVAVPGRKLSTISVFTGFGKVDRGAVATFVPYWSPTLCTHKLAFSLVIILREAQLPLRNRALTKVAVAKLLSIAIMTSLIRLAPAKPMSDDPAEFLRTQRI